jgi:repressor LexA
MLYFLRKEKNMGKTPPGETRKRVFQFVQERLLAGFPPTVREVQEAFRFQSVQTARQHLETLVEEGYLVKEKGKARGYRLPGTSKNRRDPTSLVPLLGRVAAGALTTAVETPEGYIPVQSRFSPGELFALRVEGESMVMAGILPGDIAVVRRQSHAESGDIVVALVGEEATVKRLFFRGRRVELHPENPAFKPIIPDPGELKLLGKVIEIRRKLE